MKILTVSFVKVWHKTIWILWGEEKTLIFCVSDAHADVVVEQMKLALDKFHGAQPDNTVMKITGSIRDPRGAIREYKNERLAKYCCNSRPAHHRY